MNTRHHWAELRLDSMKNWQEQAEAELCQAQGKFRRAKLALDLYLIDKRSYDFGPEMF